MFGRRKERDNAPTAAPASAAPYLGGYVNKKWAINELPALLDPDETIIAVFGQNQGELRNNALVLTDRRVMFVDRKMIQLNMQHTTLLYQEISGVREHKAMLHGSLTIIHKGGDDRTFEKMPGVDVPKASAMIREQIARATSGGANATGTHMASIPEQLQQLGDLHKQGILTDQEFAAKKVELLHRM